MSANPFSALFRPKLPFRFPHLQTARPKSPLKPHLPLLTEVHLTVLAFIRNKGRKNNLSLLGYLDDHDVKSAKTFSTIVCQCGHCLPFIHYLIKKTKWKQIYLCKSRVSWFVPSLWYRSPGYWCAWSCLRSLHLSSSLPQEYACISRCSSRSFSHHRSPCSEILPLLHCVSLASHQPNSTSSVSVQRTPWCDVRCVRSSKWDQATSCWRWGTSPMKGTCSCPLHAHSTSRVLHRSSSCCLIPRSRMTCTSHTSCERC